MSSTPPIALPEAWQTSLTTHLLSLLSTIPLLPLLLLIPTTILLLLALHRTYNHPLSQIPGPLLSRLTSLPLYISSYLGHEARLLTSLHALHGPIIRIGPNEVLISDGAVLPQIYTTSENASKGGFLKAPCYENFHGENGHETIFSTLDPEYRKTRARAVMPLFGAGEIRRGSAVLEGCVGRLVGRLRREAKESLRSKRKVDVLALARMWALDSVSAYLFGEGYGALEQGVTAGYEDSGKEEGNGEIHLDAAAYVDSITAFGRFFFLPNELFLRLMGWIEYFAPDPQAAASLAKVDEYVTPMVDRAAAGEEKLVGTFQDRLLKAGISKEETAVQVKDVIFAGTDTTAMNLATIIWWLARKPEVHDKLRHEILESENYTSTATTAPTMTNTTDPSSSSTSTFLTGGTNHLPYLDAVIREGLRLSRANPTRLPRIVPPRGWTYTAPATTTATTTSSSSSSSAGKTYFLPPGTQISQQISTLHQNPSVFADPWDFVPERWLTSNSASEKMEEGGEKALQQQHRDFFPFGLGARVCIARALATQELIFAVRGVVRSGVLGGCDGEEDGGEGDGERGDGGNEGKGEMDGDGKKGGGGRAKAVGEGIRIKEWFNAKVVGGKIEVGWE